MRKNISLILTAITACALAVSCSRQSEFPRERYVLASDGLVVRTAPDISSERIDTLPFAAKVSLLAKSDHEFEVTGSDGGKIRERWYRISFQGRDGWIFGGFLGDFDELNRRIEQAKKSDARFVPEAYRHLVEGAPKRIDRILYYPGGDMRPAEMYFMKNGLLIVDSEIFSPRKTKYYFTYEFNKDRSELTISFVDSRIKFDDYTDGERQSKSVISIDNAARRIRYRMEADRANKKLARICFLGWCFNEK